jgi:hypothetical protein
MHLRQLSGSLDKLADEARATVARLEKDARALGKKHLAALRIEAREKLVAGILDLAAKLTAYQESAAEPRPAKPTLRRSDQGIDWYVIDHVGSEASVEGPAEEMRSVATAIEQRSVVAFRRCAVHASGPAVRFWSPRNDGYEGRISHEEAAALVVLIRKELGNG